MPSGTTEQQYQKQLEQCAEYARYLAERPSVHEIDWKNWQATVTAVLCYISNPRTDEVLLIRRLGSYAHGLISGPGGKMEACESLEQCVVRECLEEVGLEPHGFELGADLFFHFINGVRMRGYAYFTDQWSGEAVPSEEAIPFWCKRDRLPLQQMWPDDALWLPHLLDNFARNGYDHSTPVSGIRQSQVQGYFIFDQDNQMLSHKLAWTSDQN